MNANETLLLKDEVYRILGCAIAVLNGLGHGLHEKPYENAMVVEFGLQEIPSSSNRASTAFTKPSTSGNTCRT